MTTTRHDAGPEQAFLAFEPCRPMGQISCPKRPIFAFFIFAAKRDFDYEMSFWNSPTQVIVLLGDTRFVRPERNHF